MSTLAPPRRTDHQASTFPDADLETLLSLPPVQFLKAFTTASDVPSFPPLSTSASSPSEPSTGLPHALVQAHARALSTVWNDLHTSPSYFLTGLTALSHASCGDGSVVPSPPFPSGKQLCIYAQTVLSIVSDIATSLPDLLTTALPNSSAYITTKTTATKTKTKTKTTTTSPSSSVELSGSPVFVPTHPKPLVTQPAECEVSAPRLRINLETAWDGVLAQRRRPGAPDARPLHGLHPACADALAARLVDLITTDAAAAPDRLRMLGERLAGPGGSGVVLHRLPPAVRDGFAAEQPAHLLFFLDVIAAADSARLSTALAPRLAAAVGAAVATAASATVPGAFAEAVLRARLYARLLTAVRCAPGWSHSPAALSGARADGDRGGVPLTATALVRRAEVEDATWTALLDIERMLTDAVRSESMSALVVTIAVADAVLRCATLDPVTRATRWFERGVTFVMRLVVVDERDRLQPVLRVLLGELCEAVSARENGMVGNERDVVRFVVAHVQWPVLHDNTVARAVCPILVGVRRTLQPRDRRGVGEGAASGNISRNARGHGGGGGGGGGGGSGATPARATRRIRPLPAGTPPATPMGPQMDQEDEMQIRLRKEFEARLDGRVRELVGVVIAARPQSRKRAREMFLSVVHTLYPSTPQTVAAVAGELCAMRVAPTTGSAGLAKRGEGVSTGRHDGKRGDAVDRGKDREMDADAGVGGLRSALDRATIDGASDGKLTVVWPSVR